MYGEEESDELDEAIASLEEFLAAPQSRDEMRLTAIYDQFGAKLRDMTVEQREEVAQNLASQPPPEGQAEELTVEEARDWIARMISKE